MTISSGRRMAQARGETGPRGPGREERACPQSQDERIPRIRVAHPWHKVRARKPAVALHAESVLTSRGKLPLGAVPRAKRSPQTIGFARAGALRFGLSVYTLLPSRLPLTKFILIFFTL